MTKATAAVLARFQQPLEIREYPVPDQLGPGEALVRVEMAGICGTDVHLWLGQLKIPIPVVLGHEAVGFIEKLGPGIEKDWRGMPLAEGDRVTWASSIVCGECFYCRVKRQPTRCLGRTAYGISYCADQPPHLRGGYAQRIVLRAGSAIFRMPDALPSDALVGAGCGLTTALHGLERAGIQMGDVVIVQGAGPVGLAALAVAREAGARKTILIGGPAHRLELARQFGADTVIPVDEIPDPRERQRLAIEASGGYGADLVAECVGHPSAVPEGLEMCRDGGAYLVLGQYADAGEVSMNPHVITRKQLRVVGSWGFEPRHVDAAINLLEVTRWKDLFARQITHRFPLERADDALQSTRELRGGKTVIVP